MLNHESLHTVFERSPQHCRTIYDSVREHYGNNGHFWLQYGAYELAYGDLDLSENYLLQAKGHIPGSEQLATTFGHLYFRKAIEARSLMAADEFLEMGQSILRQQVSQAGLHDPFPYHVLGSQKLGYINRWVGKKDRVKALQELQREIEPGVRQFPMAGNLRRLCDDLKEAELMAVVKDD